MPQEPEEVAMVQEGEQAPDFGLSFTLLGDPDHDVLEAYGVWGQKKMYGKTFLGVARSTFVIGPDGVVRRVLRKVRPAEHDDLVLGALANAA